MIVKISLGSEEFEPIREEDGGADLSPRPIEDCLGLYIWILSTIIFKKFKNKVEC